MRDQFLDELGGVHVLPESSKGAGRMEVTIDERVAGRPLDEHGERAVAARSTAWLWVVGAAVIALAAVFWVGFSDRGGGQTSSAAMPPPQVTVSKPLARDVDTRIGLLGQFSAIDRVELRAQVGGTLTEIHFQDGQIVHKGDLLFMIDPRPYEIKLAKATAQLQTASARFALASVQLSRAQTLLRTTFGTAETVDQRTSEQSSAQAAIDDAKAQIRDAQLDIEYCRITAPFPGRISARLVSHRIPARHSHWAETAAGGSAICRWPPALVNTTRSGASPAARGMEIAADCPAANIVSNRSTAAFSLTPRCVVTTTWRPSGSSR